MHLLFFLCFEEFRLIKGNLFIILHKSVLITHNEDIISGESTGINDGAAGCLLEKEGGGEDIVYTLFMLCFP